MKKEIWKDINNYEGLYQVSNYGKIRNSRGKILKLQVNHRGYHKITLSKNNKKKNFFVHRLVLETFNPVEDMENLVVNHIDAIKDNNYIENLEWLTHKENMEHASKNDLYSEEGKKNRFELLKKSGKIRRVGKFDVHTGELLEEFDSPKEASEKTNTNAKNIRLCCNGKLEKTKGYKWKYLN